MFVKMCRELNPFVGRSIKSPFDDMPLSSLPRNSKARSSKPATTWLTDLNFRKKGVTICKCGGGYLLTAEVFGRLLHGALCTVASSKRDEEKVRKCCGTPQFGRRDAC